MVDSTPGEEPLRPGRLARPRAILFDWDNTLIDSWHAIQDAQNHTFAAFGMPPWTLDETKERVRGSMRDTYPDLFGDRWLEAGQIFYQRFAARHLETLTPLPGAEDLLSELHRSGVALAVVSNKKGDYLREEAARLGWKPWFHRLVGAFDAARDKPAIEPVLLALEDTGIAPGDAVWFVGDADIDLACGANAGCVPVLLRQDPPTAAECASHPPVLHVTNCMALLMVLRTL
jgi:phosphoglycolate phosphatase